MAKILIIEDNEMSRDMLTRRLQRKGYEVMSAKNGEQGLAFSRADKPDLILMDISLPGIDGWEVARILKGDQSTSQIPIIALTAHVLENDRARALAAGCDDYDIKPIELERLLEKIENLLSETNLP